MDGRMLKEPEELRFVGTIGILKESTKVLACKAKLFAGLTMALIVPLCVVGMGHSLITEPMAARISWDEYLLRRTPSGTETEDRIDADIHREMAKLYAVFAAYLFFLLAFSLLSTSAIVYTVASIYTDKSTPSYHKLLFTVVPRVWKRLFLTFMWAILLIFCYCALFFAAFVLISVVWVFIFLGSEVAMAILNWVGIVGFIAGLIYVDCVWHLGSVVAVLEEEAYGIEAMKRSVRLIEGRRAMAYGLYWMYFGLTLAMGMGFSMVVVHGEMLGLGAGWRVLIGAAIIGGLAALDLMGFVVQTVFYLACKAYHNESIDKLRLSEHLGVYLGEYVPLRSSIQLEETTSTIV